MHASSSPICMPSLPLPTTTHIMLHMPLVVQKANNETFLFHLAIMNKVKKLITDADMLL
jgi:hypothetical protein